MCGIAGGYGGDAVVALRSLSHRGPDDSGSVRDGDGWLAHTRLAIIDPDPRSAQPLRYGETTISFNGEIWNYREIRADLEREGLEFHTEGDGEVLAAALDCWGEEALPRLEGMFAVAWTTNLGEIRIARDRHGEVPLHVSDDLIAFGSERRTLIGMGARHTRWVQPGDLEILRPGRPPERRSWYRCPDITSRAELQEAASSLRDRLAEGTRERSISDVPVCCLLSGGIDSAAIALLARDALPGLVAYTAVMDERNRDLRFARIAAEALGIDLVEVPVEAPTAEDLADVIRLIEMPHKAQVEIGWACLALARAMRSDGFKVTYSGEGSDELWASYGMSYHGINRLGWGRYRRRLFRDQHRKNFARCNKIFMAHGVECRLPFLNTGLVEYALALPQRAVRDGARRPKAIMQEAFRDDLPREVLDRPKLAFQDGIDLKAAAARSVADPRRFYNAEYRRHGFRDPP